MVTAQNSDATHVTEGPIKLFQGPEPSYEGVSIGTLNDSEATNVTEGRVNILKDPLSTNQNKDTFNDRRENTKTSLKSDSTNITKGAFIVSESYEHPDEKTQPEPEPSDEGDDMVTAQNSDATHVTEGPIKLFQDCNIKAIRCSDNSIEIQSTFGAWMSDASLPDDRIWVADHFSGYFLRGQES
ncbi:uncharacterized protein FYW61_006871 [Anableps anableps]